MKKIIYIIPGNGENCKLARYKKLASVLSKQGYLVKLINPDWYRPMSEQIFKVEKDAILFGFSFGAVLAYLVAKKCPCKKVIFASLSPIHTFSYKSLVDDLKPYMSEDKAIKISKDIKKIKISLNELKTPHVTLMGESEKMDADFLVPKTGHYLSPAYIRCVSKLL